jgi:sugar phosphate isomerase/epimerase
MSTPLALHHFTLFDISPFELVPIAASVGCGAVCIFVNSPDDPAPGHEIEKINFPLVTRDNRSRFTSLLTDHGVRVTNLEFFPLAAETEIVAYRDTLELGAELGARLAVTHIYDTVRDRALERLVEFGNIAAEFELSLGLEFMGLSPGCSTLEQALDFVRSAKQDNIGIGIDAIHLHLTGGQMAELANVPAEFIAYAQLCDTCSVFDAKVASRPDLYLPLVFEREVPGKGIIPLQKFIRALPEDTYYDVEVPWPSRAAHGISPEKHARRSVEAARNLWAAG